MPLGKEFETLLEAGSVAQIGEAYRKGRLSIEQSVGWFLARIDRLNYAGSHLNAVKSISARGCKKNGIERRGKCHISRGGLTTRWVVDLR